MKMKANSMIFRMAKGAFCFALTLALLLGSLVLPAAAYAEETGVVTAKVVMRKSADKESRALQTLPKGEEVKLLGSSGDFYKVNYGSYTGYIMKKYVKKSAGSTAKAASKISELGTAPGVMRVGDSNADVKKLQQALEILGYYDGKIDGDYGKGTTAAVMQYQKDKELEIDGYAGKTTVASIFGSCGKVSLTTQPDPTEAAASGKAAGASSIKTGSKYQTVESISEIGSAPSACKQGDTGTNVVKLQQALECLGYYSGGIDGDYGAGTVAAVKKLQKNRGMKEDGIAGASTLRVLFGGSADAGSTDSKTYKTETLDWFEDKMTNVIPKNAKVTIKDVKTGKTFEAVRWSGANHMDTEPRTAEDTAILKSIYGGSWSWSRRAILVRYNGHVYAASMNGMPHGTTTISNGFDGHFCVHFKNSMTHGSKKVDPDHQSAVTTASKATW